jgi:hypothetical protein
LSIATGGDLDMIAMAALDVRACGRAFQVVPPVACFNRSDRAGRADDREFR